MTNHLSENTPLRTQEIIDGSLEQMLQDRGNLFALVRYMVQQDPKIQVSPEIRNIVDDIYTKEAILDTNSMTNLYVFINDNLRDRMSDSRSVLNFKIDIEYGEKVFVEGPIVYDDLVEVYRNSTGIVEGEIDQEKLFSWCEQNGYIDMYPVLRNYMNKIESALKFVSI